MGVRFALTITLSLVLFACGNENSQEGTATSAGGTDGNENVSSSEIDCVISSLEEALPSNCRSISMGANLLAGGSTDSSGNFRLTASRRSGGSGGTKWFNLTYRFPRPQSVSLPAEITATGNAGNGQKLYIRFNSNLDCAWYSSATRVYLGRRCFSGASRAPSTSSGFVGGTEIIVGTVADVSAIEMTVNGSSGIGVLTTAVAVFVRN
jgi:hypothetical protein